MQPITVNYKKGTEFSVYFENSISIYLHIVLIMQLFERILQILYFFFIKENIILFWLSLINQLNYEIVLQRIINFPLLEAIMRN